MAKRGETRPWRVTFEWANSDIKGTDSFTTADSAYLKVNQLRRNAYIRDNAITVTVQHRDQPDTRKTFTFQPDDEE